MEIEMIKHRRTSTLHAVMLALALSLVACGDDTDDTGTSNNVNNVNNANNTNNGTNVNNMSTDMGSPDADNNVTADISMVECGEPTGMRPPQISEHAGVFAPDDAEGKVVIFGGSLGIPENCGIPQRTAETTTWIYDVACDSWSRLESQTNPPGRSRHSATYDEANNRMIVFGGISGQTALGDTWALDLDSGEWSEIQTTGDAPDARFNHGAAYDPAGRLVVFGGNAGTVLNIEVRADVYVLDLETNTWSDGTPAVSGPAPRTWTSALWDSTQQQLVAFGGGDSSAFGGTVDYFEDVWAWKDQGGTPGWIKLDTNVTTQPEGRFWAGWSYDPVNEQYVLFGGHDDTNLGNKNDTWFFDPATGQWTEHLEGDILNSQPNGFCDFPADFTLVEQESPERRNGHVFVAGPTGAYTMGGKTDCGIVDDLARFDFETQSWEVLTRATAGEVCLRKGGGDTCSSMCL